MIYKKLLLNVAISALIGVILGILLYKLFLGITVWFIVHIIHEEWYLSLENYFAITLLLVTLPYILYLWHKKIWILGIATFFLLWITSLSYFQCIKYDDAASIGIDCLVVQKGNKVGIVDKWGHAITDTDFDGYCSCGGVIVNDSTIDEKPINIIGILLKDRAFYAINREAQVYKADQIREIKSPYPFKDIQANAYSIKDYCINYEDKNDVFGYIVYSTDITGDKNWYLFFNQHGQFIAGGEEFVLNNEGTLSLKRGNSWFDYTGHIYKEMNERQTYVFDFGEEHGGKQISKFDDFSDDVIDISSFLPINNGDHTYMLVSSNREQTEEKPNNNINNQQSAPVRTPTPVQRPQRCGVCSGSGGCSNCGGSGISNYGHSHICGACNSSGKCATCAGSGISGYITEYVY